MLNFCDFIQVYVFTTNHHLNGRIFCNTGKMTCYTPNGESLIDYIVTGEYNFASFSNVTA